MEIILKFWRFFIFFFILLIIFLFFIILFTIFHRIFIFVFYFFWCFIFSCRMSRSVDINIISFIRSIYIIRKRYSYEITIRIIFLFYKWLRFFITFHINRSGVKNRRNEINQAVLQFTSA